MTTKTKKTPTDTGANRPTHRAVFRRKLKEGYANPVEIGGAWQNSKGGISFPLAGGSVTVWPIDKKEDDKVGA